MTIRLTIDISDELDFKLKSKLLKLNKIRDKGEKKTTGQKYINNLLENDLIK